MKLYSILQQKDLERYATYKRFYDNNFSTYEKQALDVDARFYIAANITKSIIDVTPDFLLGETPKITADNTKQALIDFITETSEFGTVLFDASQTASLKGKAYIKLYLLNGQVKAQSLEPDDVIVEKDLYQAISKATILTTLEEREDNTILALKEEMTKEEITRSLIVLDEARDIKTEMALTENSLTSILPPVETNLFKMIPVVELKNNSQADSDIAGCETLILAINKRLSEIDYIITKHADPKLQIPQGILEKAGADIIATGSTTFVHVDGIDNKDFKMLEVSPNDKDMKYVQPNLDLTAAYEELDRLVNYLLNQTKTATSLVQTIKDGGQVESAKALKQKLMNTDRKLRQKKVFITKAIRQFYNIAQILLQEAPVRVDVEYIDIINDRDSAIENAVKLYTNNVISKKEALRMAYPTTDEAIIQEMYLEALEEAIEKQNDEKLRI